MAFALEPAGEEADGIRLFFSCACRACVVLFSYGRPPRRRRAGARARAGGALAMDLTSTASAPRRPQQYLSLSTRSS